MNIQKQVEKLEAKAGDLQKQITELKSELAKEYYVIDIATKKYVPLTEQHSTFSKQLFFSKHYGGVFYEQLFSVYIEGKNGYVWAGPNDSLHQSIYTCQLHDTEREAIEHRIQSNLPVWVFNRDSKYTPQDKEEVECLGDFIAELIKMDSACTSLTAKSLLTANRTQLIRDGYGFYFGLQ